MKTVKVKLMCHMCGKFEIEHFVNINKHGYFGFPEAHCPECLAILNAVIDHEDEIDNARRSNSS